MSQDRVDKIVEILLETNQSYITIDEIAEKLNVSNKTVRNDLKVVEKVLFDEGVYVEKKPRYGIRIKVDEEKRVELLQNYKFKSNFIEPYSPQFRRDYILKRLLMKKSNITIAELAQELYVSKVTIHKDIGFVQKWLKEFNLKLIKKTNYGIQIVGDEENFRNAIAHLIVSEKDKEELEEILFNNITTRLDFKTIERLKELVDLDYKLLEKIVENAEEKMGARFTDDAFISLIIHIAISIKRLKEGNDISIPQDVVFEIKEKEEFKVALEVTKNIEKAFGVKFPKSEVIYILLHILGAKMQQNKKDDVLNLVNNIKEDDLSIDMAKEIIDIAQRSLGTYLEKDEQLLKGLILHLRPTINRLKYGLALRNPVLNEIKENYSEFFGVAWMASTVFNKYLGVKIPEEEIGYIALHIGAAVERNIKPFKVLVVCSSGIGTSQLLAARIQKSFREIDIIDTISYLELEKIKLDEIDFIISTIPISNTKPVLQVKPILTQNDIKKIEYYINYMKNRKDNKAFLEKLIDEDLIFLDCNFEKQNEVLKFLSNELTKRDYVDKEYYKKLIEREKMTYTSIGNGVAIPHANPELVKKSKISLLTLKEPIIWGNEYVDVVLMISIAQNDLKEGKFIFKNLYNAIEERSFIEKIKTAKNILEAKQIIGGVLNGD
ncbi:MAG: BglG family transcription antiterminator [Caloramator sp.]|nr:BglG family transcription antiterminator [Caloramator sp.]